MLRAADSWISWIWLPDLLIMSYYILYRAIHIYIIIFQPEMFIDSFVCDPTAGENTIINSQTSNQVFQTSRTDGRKEYQFDMRTKSSTMAARRLLL